MGDDEIIPNGSVHWQITHERVVGGGRQRRKWNKTGSIATDNNENVEVAPNLESIRGVDGIGNTDAQRLEVTLRFRTKGELEAELSQAIATVAFDNVTNLWVAKFNMLSNGANVTPQQAQGPPPNRWAQVHVHW